MLKKQTVTIAFILMLGLSSCENINDNKSNNITVPKDVSEEYRLADQLAKKMAMSQSYVRKSFVHEIKNSKISESILNVTQMRKTIKGVKKNADFQLSARATINSFLEEPIDASGTSLIEELDELSPADINVYFPSPNHRRNVLKEDQSFLVAADVPNADDTKEYFIKAYDSEGNSHIFSSLKEPKENVLIIARSEGQDLRPAMAPYDPDNLGSSSRPAARGPFDPNVDEDN